MFTWIYKKTGFVFSILNYVMSRSDLTQDNLWSGVRPQEIQPSYYNYFLVHHTFVELLQTS